MSNDHINIEKQEKSKKDDSMINDMRLLKLRIESLESTISSMQNYIESLELLNKSMKRDIESYKIKYDIIKQDYEHSETENENIKKELTEIKSRYDSIIKNIGNEELLDDYIKKNAEHIKHDDDIKKKIMNHIHNELPGKFQNENVPRQLINELMLFSEKPYWMNEEIRRKFDLSRATVCRHMSWLKRLGWIVHTGSRRWNGRYVLTAKGKEFLGVE